MTSEERDNQRQENEALKSAKKVAKRKPKVKPKNNFKCNKTAILPVLIVMVKVMAVAFLILGVVALFDSILDGGGTNKDNQDDLISSVRTSSLEAYLKQFSHTGDAPQSSDGMFYKMYGDGVGWPTIGNSDLQWKSHQDSFACQGKVFDGEEEKTVENVKDYVNGFLTRGSNATYTNEEVSAMNIYIEKELVDKVGDEVREGVYNYVISYIQTQLNYLNNSYML